MNLADPLFYEYWQSAGGYQWTAGSQGWRTQGLPTSTLVIPGRPVGPDPESRNAHGIAFWIPGSLAALAPRNDRRGPGLSHQRHSRDAPKARTRNPETCLHLDS